jgi:hypothetical protein
LNAGIPQRLAYDNGKYFKLTVNPPGVAPLEYFNSVNVMPGIINSIRLNRNSYSQYQYPYSDCTVLDDNTLVVPLDDPSMFELTLLTNYTYTRQYCLSICQQVWTARTCGCSGYYVFYVVSNTSLCVDGMRCADQQVGANMTVSEYCNPLCPLECSATLIGIDYAGLPLNGGYLSGSEAVMNFDFSKDSPSFNENEAQYVYDNVVVIDIRYTSTEYIATSEEPKMTWQDLLGELSGHLHLFLGMSLLSFVEIAELFILSCFNKIKRITSRSKVHASCSMN